MEKLLSYNTQHMNKLVNGIRGSVKINNLTTHFKQFNGSFAAANLHSNSNNECGNTKFTDTKIVINSFNNSFDLKPTAAAIGYHPAGAIVNLERRLLRLNSKNLLGVGLAMENDSVLEMRKISRIWTAEFDRLDNHGSCTRNVHKQIARRLMVEAMDRYMSKEAVALKFDVIPSIVNCWVKRCMEHGD